MNDGGYAFPRATTLSPITGQQWNDEQYGMSLRDYFAARAMQALIPMTFEAVNEAKTIKEKAILIAGIAPSAYEIADSMLREQAKSTAGKTQPTA